MSDQGLLFDLGEKKKGKSTLRTMNGSGRNKNHRRAENDFYPTPEIAVSTFLDVEKFNGNIWEPACGNGAMSRVMERYGYIVESSDLIDRGYGKGGVDFIRTNKTVDNIVTNPPFKIAAQFAHHAINHTRQKVALLLRIQFLETRNRRPLFLDMPFARTYVFSDRVPFVDGNAMCYAWFVWEHGYKGEPIIRWL